MVVWKRRGRKNKQINNWKSSGSRCQRWRTRLLVDPCCMLWDCSTNLTGESYVFASHVTSFLMVLQTTFLPRGRIWSVNIGLHRARKSSVIYYQPRALRRRVSAHLLATLTPRWKSSISTGSGPNMKTGEPKRGHPSAEQVLFFFSCDKNLSLIS